MYATCNMSIPAAALNISATKWLELPAPAEAKFSSPGCFLARLDEITDRVRGKRVIDDDHQRRARCYPDLREIINGIERQLPVERGICG